MFTNIFKISYHIFGCINFLFACIGSCSIVIHYCIYNCRVFLKHCHTTSTHQSTIWKTAASLRYQFPVIASICTFVNTTCAAGRLKIPCPAGAVPHAGIQFVRVLLVNVHLNSTCVFINSQRLFPCFSTICCFVNAPFLIGRIQMPQCSYPYYICIGRMQNYFTNMMTFGQANIRPVFSIIGRFIYTITAVTTATAVNFTRTNPYYSGLPVYGYITNRNYIFLIKNWGKTKAIVYCMP